MGFPVWALPSCFLGGDHFPTSTFPGGAAGQMPRHRELWRKIPKIAGWGSYEEDKVGVILWSWTFGHCKIMQDHDRSPFFLFHWTQWSTSNSKPQQLKFGSMWDPPNKRGQRPAVPRGFFFPFPAWKHLPWNSRHKLKGWNSHGILGWSERQNQGH